MRSRWTASALGLVMLVSLLGVRWASPIPVHAQGDCPATYTVQRGDNLFRIALRHNTTIPRMMELNHGRIHNPRLIYTGQVICVPAPAVRSNVVIEATYQYVPSPEEEGAGWNLLEGGGYIGRREVYPLVSGNPIESIDELGADLLDVTPAPILLGLETGTSPKEYALLAIGDGQVLTAIAITDAITDATSLEAIFPQDGCPDLQAAAVLGMGSDLGASVNVWLESEEGLRYPFPIAHVGFFRDLEEALLCHDSDPVVFALFPAGLGEADAYRVSLVLTEGGLGPPGGDWHKRCSNWTKGAFHGLMRALHGCPPR